MRNEQFVFGKDLLSAKKKSITENIYKIKAAALRGIEGEYEKRPEDVQFINMISGFLKTELQKLGITDFVPLRPEQFHFMDGDAYDQLEPEDDYTAFASPMKSAAYVDMSRMGHRLELYATILHEAIHICALEKNQVINEGDRFNIANYRTGYNISTEIEDEFGESHEHFRGFNEAVTDLIVIEILRKHQDELRSKLEISPEEEYLPVSFSIYRILLERIMHKIAEKQDEDYSDVWERFKKGAFTGEMMHLRDVERTFGKGSLRFLAAAYSGVNKANPSEIDEKIFRFFETDDENERVQIAREVLDRRERFNYHKRRA